MLFRKNILELGTLLEYMGSHWGLWLEGRGFKSWQGQITIPNLAKVVNMNAQDCITMAMYYMAWGFPMAFHINVFGHVILSSWDSLSKPFSKLPAKMLVTFYWVFKTGLNSRKGDYMIFFQTMLNQFSGNYRKVKKWYCKKKNEFQFLLLLCYSLFTFIRFHKIINKWWYICY